MLGYVHLLPETRPALERRTVAGTALWVLEGDLDGGSKARCKPYRHSSGLQLRQQRENPRQGS